MSTSQPESQAAPAADAPLPAPAAEQPLSTAAPAPATTQPQQPVATAVAGDQQPPQPAETAAPEPQPVDFRFAGEFVRSALVASTHDVEIIRSDVNSPLYATVSSFEELNLDPALVQGLYVMDIKKPSKIQETALPILIKERKNMIAQSQSGTGKTIAFLLAALSRVDVSQKYPQVIILSPTYELAVQTYNVATTMAKFKSEITIKLVVKGGPEHAGHNPKWTETVLIGTPGRMSDSILKFRNADISKIKVYVLDEADNMIDTQGHKTLSMRIRRALPNDCQILFFSATYNDEIRKFASDIVPNAVEIHLKREELSLANIKQIFIVTRTEDDKYRALETMMSYVNMGQAFIFCRTKKSANFLAQKLRDNMGHQVGMISGDLNVQERNEALEKFKQGAARVMISTNLMARGIDIDGVSFVVNYDLPTDVNGILDKETYLHRIGRTGRFGKSGIAINLVGSEHERRMITELEEYFKIKIEEVNPHDSDQLEQLSEAV